MSSIKWPRKTRELQNHHMDSTVWNDFVFRDDDIVIANYSKGGSTWMQQIVAQLVFDGADDLSLRELTWWVDMRVPPKEVKLAKLEAQQHRRFVKTHLPLDALVFSPRAKYIYIGRDGRDVAWSMFNHHINANQGWYDSVNDPPGRVGPPLGPPTTDDPVQYFRDWLDNDGRPFWSFWDNVSTWWPARVLPNVHLVHFHELKSDMEAVIRRVAMFLDIAVAEESWPRIFEHCSFEYMKAHADTVAPSGGAYWDEGGTVFIHRGVDGRWKGILPEQDSRRYEEMSVEKLGPECAQWLATGEPPGTVRRDRETQR
jgi:aryl sulfotransferase